MCNSSIFPLLVHMLLCSVLAALHCIEADLLGLSSIHTRKALVCAAWALGMRVATSSSACSAQQRCSPMFVQHSRRLASAVVSRGAALQQWQQASCSVRPFIAARPELRQRSKRSVHVLASWGAPVEFSPAKVVSNTKVTPELHQMVVDVGADKAAGYTKGGQFVQLKVGEGKPGFFAIASPPDPNNQGLLEFLIKAKGEAAEALAALPAGAEVQSSPVMGKGFPLERIPAEACPTVLLFATGSGISPIKAVIESGALDTSSRKDVRLYYGTRSPEATAYSASIPSWEAEGIKVIQAFSEGDSGKYVQDVFAASMGLNGQPGVGVVCCGHKEMVNAVKELLAKEGVSADNVLLNF